MSKLVRLEFLGNWWVVTLLVATVYGIPFAVLYLLYGTVKIEEDMPNPNDFIVGYKQGKYQNRTKES